MNLSCGHFFKKEGFGKVTALGSAWNEEPAYLILSVEFELFEEALLGLDDLEEFELPDLDNGAELLLLLLKFGSEPSGSLPEEVKALFNLACWELGDFGDFLKFFLLFEWLELLDEELLPDLKLGLEPSGRVGVSNKFLISWVVCFKSSAVLFKITLWEPLELLVLKLTSTLLGGMTTLLLVLFLLELEPLL